MPAIWRGTRCLAELNYHAGAKYPVDRARWVPRRVPHAIRHVCDKGAGGRRVAKCVSQVLICVACMVRPR